MSVCCSHRPPFASGGIGWCQLRKVGFCVLCVTSAAIVAASWDETIWNSSEVGAVVFLFAGIDEVKGASVGVWQKESGVD